MHKLDYRGIFLQALRAPLDEWRLVLRAVALPALLYLALMVVAAGLFPDMPLYRLPGEKTALLPSILAIVPMLMFEWRWMSTLWHGDRPELTSPVLRSVRWRFIALFAAVDLVWQVVDAGPIFAYAALLNSFSVSAVGDVRHSADLVYGVIAFAISIVSVWILARLTGWDAAIIDRLQLTGPTPIWHLTRGHALRIFGIGFLVGLPSFLITLLVFTLVIALLRDQTHFILLILSAPLVVYGRAADNAASLLIYRHLTRPSDETLVF